MIAQVSIIAQAPRGLRGPDFLNERKRQFMVEDKDLVAATEQIWVIFGRDSE